MNDLIKKAVSGYARVYWKFIVWDHNSYLYHNILLYYLHIFLFQVNDIESAIVDVKAKGIRTLTESSRIGAHGKPVIFLHPKDCNGVLVELEQV